MKLIHTRGIVFVRPFDEVDSLYSFNQEIIDDDVSVLEKMEPMNESIERGFRLGLVVYARYIQVLPESESWCYIVSETAKHTEGDIMLSSKMLSRNDSNDVPTEKKSVEASYSISTKK